MLALILAGVSAVRRVDATRHTIVEQSAMESYAPFWAIEAHDVYRRSLLDAKLMQTFGEGKHIKFVLGPGPEELVAIPLSAKGGFVTLNIGSL